MNTSFLRVVLALFALTFIVAACSGGDDSTAWTFAPVTASESEDGGTAAEPDASAPAAVPAESEASAPAEPAEPEASAPAEPVDTASAGEPRVIEMQADGALRFTDASGQPMSDIAVTPGEVIRFQIDNTAGFGHNFWIGTDSELSQPSGTTEVGIPDWETGVQELEWVVPDDITDLKFACTVPGHYYTMQGTFSLGEAPAAVPAASAEPAEPEASAPAEPVDTASAGEPRVIELEADGAIRFLQDGQQIRDIPLTPGETVVFRVENTAGFAHNFYIGADSDLSQPSGTTEVGIPDWETGVQELEWVVPEDLSDLRFACTVPGHYYTMQGDFSISP